MNRKPIIAIDFDGTIVYDAFPLIGKLKPGAKEVINRYAEHNIIIIWTCRDGKYLEEVKDFLNRNGIQYHYVNENAKELTTFSPNPKIFYDVLIDDRSLGFVDNWSIIDTMLDKYLEKIK